jgi:peptide/nickel transport system substrate-binding protein
MKKIGLICLVGMILLACMLQGCGGAKTVVETKEKIFNYGTTAYGPSMGNVGLNPHENYSGWSAVRYGVGETLFKYTDTMELEPWLATSFEQVNENTVKINLRDDVYFTSGRKMDGQAVKECLEDLIKVNDRAPGNLNIKKIVADGQTVTIESTKKTPILINYLSDPYGAIIDMKAGVTKDKNVAGTGPFMATSVSDTEIHLVKNPKYWGGPVKVDKVNVKAITDGDTMTMALQSGEIDATQGLPYASLKLFKNNKDFTISSSPTSRTFFAAMNYETPALQDIKVRQAIAMAIDKKNFTEVLLNGNGSPAVGPFPDNFTFGDKSVTTASYDQQKAKELLAKAGWEDTNGDGYVDKNGQNLTLTWLTYPGRQELPLLAEAAQASLKAIGIELKVNSTANYMDFIKNGKWDIYASAFVTAPTGDPAYFFAINTLEKSKSNRGHYFNAYLETLATQMDSEFDKAKRGQIAVKMEQTILDDAAFIFASHLKMSFVMKNKVTGFKAHPSDYYEINANLDIK